MHLYLDLYNVYIKHLNVNYLMCHESCPLKSGYVTQAKPFLPTEQSRTEIAPVAKIQLYIQLPVQLYLSATAKKPSK